MVVIDRWQRNLELEPSKCDDAMANRFCHIPNLPLIERMCGSMVG